MKKNVFIPISIVMLSLLVISQLNCSGTKENKQMTQQELIARGKYLETTGGWDDCHTPKIYTANGPVPDTTRHLSGFQQGEKLPALDVKYVTPGNWVATESNFSAWVGPWGISYAANLTSDPTGIGNWQESNFIIAIREGKFKGISASRDFFILKFMIKLVEIGHF